MQNNKPPKQRSNKRNRRFNPRNRDHSAQFQQSGEPSKPILSNYEMVESNVDFTRQDWENQLVRPEADNRVKTEDVASVLGKSWSDFDIKRPVLAGLYEAGWESPSPIQEASLSYTLNGSSILARAKNGTGKTGSYLIPILNAIDTSIPRIQALVLVPTRELALQTSEVFRGIAKHTKGIQIMVTYGGTNLPEDLLRLKGTVHILIGTTGRIKHLTSAGEVNLDHCNIFALDEADRLLSRHTIGSVEYLMECMPESPQILLLSATYPPSIIKFKENYCPDAEIINLMDELTLQGITQYFAFVQESQKLRVLHYLFSKLQINQSIIFCNSVQRVEILAKRIIKLGYSCYYIHSRMPQEHRNRVFHDFRRGKCRNLVCSNVFARGIDVQSVNVVINFDFPPQPDTYLHRIGRSGRFGHLGIAINFVTMNDRKNLFSIEDKLGTEILELPKTIDPKLYVADSSLGRQGNTQVIVSSSSIKQDLPETPSNNTNTTSPDPNMHTPVPSTHTQSTNNVPMAIQAPTPVSLNSFPPQESFVNPPSVISSTTNTLSESEILNGL